MSVNLHTSRIANVLIQYRLARLLARFDSFGQLGNSSSVRLRALEKAAVLAHHIVPTVLRRPVELCFISASGVYEHSCSANIPSLA